MEGQMEVLINAESERLKYFIYEGVVGKYKDDL